MSERPPSYLRAYKLAQRVHGADFRTTLWASRESQRIRFAVMADTWPLDGKVVLDAGCGMGDFLEFLESERIRPARFIGIDALDEVIDKARRRTFAVDAEFHHADMVADPDALSIGQPEVICISGSLNTFTDRQFYRTLRDAWKRARQCLLFNFLSTHHGPGFPSEDEVARRRDPLKVLAEAFGYTRQVIVRHDYYRGHDCTMAWSREE
jgi:SAM-dependent methyltransferase